MNDKPPDTGCAAITEPPGEGQPTPVAVDVGKSAREGGAWSVISYAFSKVAGFASSIVLARLLMPEHFGLIGMVNIVLGLAQMLGNCGIGFALIHQRDDVDEYANTTWWLDLLSGVLLFSAANLCAPLAARYFHQSEQSILPLLITVSSINFLIMPIGGTMSALLTRDLRFRENTKIDLAGGLTTSVLTIAFALLGAGVWSFVIPTILSNILVAALRWNACSWRPRTRVQWRLGKKLVNFGWKMFGASVFDYLNQNADFILVGAILGERQLGLYVFAYNLGLWIVQNVSTTISAVAFPTFASLQGDPARAKGMFLKLIRVISLVGFPIVCIQWAVAPLYIGSVYGEKWLPSVMAFRLIAVYGIGRAVCAPGGTLISALGRPDISLKINAIVSPILITAIFIGSHYGIGGVALATALAHGSFVWLYIVIPFRILGWSPREALASMAPAFISSIAAAALTAYAYAALGSGTRSLGTLAVLVVFGTGCYVGINWLLFRKASVETLQLLRTTLRESRGKDAAIIS